MYVPDDYAETRTDILVEAARAIRFATLVAAGPDGRVHAAHVPMLPKIDGPRVWIEAHFARPNPLKEALSRGREALAIFRGPHAYVHPRWYPGHERRAVLPTWNYVAVEARGSARLVDDADWLRAHLTELVLANEADRDDPWALDETKDGHVDRMLPGIVGVTMAVSDIAGAWKMSQDHPLPDRRGVADGLEAMGTPDALAVAGVMRSRVLDE